MSNDTTTTDTPTEPPAATPEQVELLAQAMALDSHRHLNAVPEDAAVAKPGRLPFPRPPFDDTKWKNKLRAKRSEVLRLEADARQLADRAKAAKREADGATNLAGKARGEFDQLVDTYMIEWQEFLDGPKETAALPLQPCVWEREHGEPCPVCSAERAAALNPMTLWQRDPARLRRALASVEMEVPNEAIESWSDDVHQRVEAFAVALHRSASESEITMPEFPAELQAVLPESPETTLDEAPAAELAPVTLDATGTVEPPPDDDDEPEVAIRVGSIVVAARDITNAVPIGTRGVCYEVYDIDGRPGYSFIFTNAFYDGFSPHEVRMTLRVTGEVAEAVADYVFTNVVNLMKDFRRGVFAPAVGEPPK